MHKNAEECIESHASAGSAPPTSRQRLAGKLLALPNTSASLNLMARSGMRSEHSVRCGQTVGKPHGPARKIAWGCAWLGRAAGHKRCSRCYHAAADDAET